MGKKVQTWSREKESNLFLSSVRFQVEVLDLFKN